MPDREYKKSSKGLYRLSINGVIFVVPEICAEPTFDGDEPFGTEFETPVDVVQRMDIHELLEFGNFDIIVEPIESASELSEDEKYMVPTGHPPMGYCEDIVKGNLVDNEWIDLLQRKAEIERDVAAFKNRFPYLREDALDETEE